MQDQEDHKGEPAQPPEQDERIVPSAPVPKAKHHELTDIFAPLKLLGVDDLADKRTVPLLLQSLLEKGDQIRILESENGRLQSEKENLAIGSARQEEQLRHARRTRLVSAGMGVVGGLLTAFAFKVSDNLSIFVVLLIAGISLTVIAGVMATA